MTSVDVDGLLALDKYNVDEDSHIEVADDLASFSDEEFGKLIRVCPARLYRQDADGARRFDHAGCLECGTCRIACNGTVVKEWNNPGPLMGVVYRYG